ncbi:MAG: PLP-dependent aspartate aminotransferase family protein [Anaerolineae bacterium]|nr:PLP-dependent aspartate aminotransferase family protein [Anaerolineae bacterium]
MHFETRAIHIGHDVDPSTGAVSPPIVLSTTFERDADGGYSRGHAYTRASNPNRERLEAALAMLEGGAVAAAFGSGQAATLSVIHTLKAGDHVIMPDDLYHGTRHLLDEHYQRWGLQFSYLDMTDAETVAQAMQPNTRLVWIESPSNPRLKIANIVRIAEIAHAGGAICVCDNTWASPINQSPLALGADLVMHATTKYIGGHSDVLGGCIVGKQDDALFKQIRDFQIWGGGVPSPFDCWLLLRSIPTLPLRVQAHNDRAGRVAAFLHAHPNVATVNYPGLASHPNHDIAAEQMRGFGGMLSFEVKGGQAEALAVAAKVKLFTRATSLGGFESLIEHRASMEGPHSKTSPTLLRCSIGLEHPDDLIADLAQALGSL